MKFYSQIIAVCVAHSSVLGAGAFFVQAPSSGIHSATALRSSNSFSYSYLNGDDATSTNSTRTSSSSSTSSTGSGTSSPSRSSSSGSSSSSPTPLRSSSFSGTGQGDSTPLRSTFNYAKKKGDEYVDERITYNPAVVADLTNPTEMKLTKSAMDKLKPVTVQGGSLRTCVPPSAANRVQVLLKTDGRPLNANVELWQGPDNTPQKMAIYIEDGALRPFSAVIETPRSNNAIAIYNTGHLEFPMAACVEPDAGNQIGAIQKKLASLSIPKTIQGGAIQTYPFSPAVTSVQVMLKTDGRPLNARIELLQGPNNNKQVMEVYTEDGLERPFFAVIETPGVGNVVRVVNTGTVEFPLTVNVEPYVMDPDAEYKDGGWDDGPNWDNGGGSLFFNGN